MDETIRNRRIDPIIPHVGAILDGRFELRAPLGEGAFSTVWVAWDRYLKCEIALKVLRSQSVGIYLDEIAREVRTGRTLSHPGIVRIFELHPEIPAISMELVRGGSLKSAKSPKGRLDYSELAPIAREICAALIYAHEDRVVVHRDLKSANILIDIEGRPKISDFGLAVRLRDETLRSGDGSGTPAFMGPQQLLGKPPAPPDDIYSLGATLYDVLAGDPPFGGASVVDQILNHEPRRISDRLAEKGADAEPIPAHYEDAILSCLSKDPDQRPRTVRELLARLDGDQTAADRPSISALSAPAAFAGSTEPTVDRKRVQDDTPTQTLHQTGREVRSGPESSGSTLTVVPPQSIADPTKSAREQHRAEAENTNAGVAGTATDPPAGRTIRWRAFAAVAASLVVIAAGGRVLLSGGSPGPTTASAEKPVLCLPSPVPEEVVEVEEEPVRATPPPAPVVRVTYEIELGRFPDLASAREALQRYVSQGVSARRVELSPGGPFAIRLGNRLSRSEAESMASRVLRRRGLPYQIVEIR